jgi:hypothetical protein
MTDGAFPADKSEFHSGEGQQTPPSPLVVTAFEVAAPMEGSASLSFPSPSALGLLAANWGLLEQLSEHEISGFPELCCSGADPVEARERLLAVSPPFVPALAVSPRSFPLSLQPQLYKPGL